VVTDAPQDGVAAPEAAIGGPPAAPAAGAVTRLLAPLREPAFALYFAGQLLSQAGNGIYLVALPFVVLNHGGDPVRLGVALAGNGLARLAAFPVGGWLVDRFGARRVMLVTDVLQAVAVAGFAMLSLLDRIPLAALLAFAVPAGALAGLFLPASLAVLPQIVSRRSLGAANSVEYVMQSSAQIGGPALGAVLVGSLHTTTGLLVDAVTFGVSSATLFAIARVRTPGPGGEVAAADESPADAADGPLRTWASVLRYIGGSFLLRMSLLITLVVNVAWGGMTEVALPSFAAHPLGGGASAFGVIMTGFGAGAMVGALCGEAFLRLRRRGLVALVLGVAQGLAVLVIPLGASLTVATGAMATVAALQAVLNVFYLTMLQRNVPSRALGRVMSLLAMCAFAAYPLSGLLAGAVTQAAGPTAVIDAAGISIAAAFCVGFVSRRYREL
jgi:MFS family permease